MRIAKTGLVLVVAAVVALVTGVGVASAATTLRTDPGGGLLSGATTVRNTTSGPVTLAFPEGHHSCSQAFFDADVTRNASTSSITGTLTSLTFTSCTDTLPGVVFLSCALNPLAGLPTIHLTATSSTGGLVSLGHTAILCTWAGTGGSCAYTQTSATGAESNLQSSLTFTNVAVSIFGGIHCGSGSGSFTYSFTHLVQGGTNRTVTLTTS